MAVTESSPAAKPQIQIRNATDADIPAIIKLGRRVFTKSFGHSVEPHELQAYLDSAYTVAAITKDFEDPDRDTIVATTDDGRLAGFAMLTRNSVEPCVKDVEKTVELQRIYVDDTLQGCGVGGKLSRAIDDMAREQGFANIWLGVWEENLIAQRAYERWGYAKVGKHDFAVGPVVQTDDIMLKKL
ncbi:acyl-CoA N-acyltransferase [Plectosphaerella cucumerina]|uniref:Acyl-CoA N-acyltransferase n=1 Tax=Plectosphaerella cucumerina TaxID=40658 RepID=A0A8K0TK64_9PEZI|nr:acyl-CoA N-acyltransferase [Plectosphaerella cucumerina]